MERKSVDKYSEETPKRKKIKLLKKKDNSPKNEKKSKKDYVKDIINSVQEKQKNLEKLEASQENIDKKITILKKEINDWMKKSGREKISWNNRSINTFSCSKLKRTDPSDILEFVGKSYGNDSLEKVIAELDKLHTLKYEGQYDIRFLSDEKTEKKSRKKRKQSVIENPSKKKKLELIL